MSKSKYRSGPGIDPFAPRSPEEADNAIFSGGRAADDLVDPRIVATPTALDAIWADVRQPRRAIPASVRMHWTGSPDDVPELLNQWYIVATQQAGIQINLVDILVGRGDGVDVPEDAPAIFREYIAMVRLAADIHQIGLTNPISVVEQRGKYLIETGERRWLAFWLLLTTLQEERWGKIPAQKSDGRDFVWRQASENTARRQLNAIGMARQLALLIMETRRGLDGVQYDEYETLVLPGGCDRRFYAQIANGNLHSVPRGQGERIEQAMGLSKHQLSQYRRLLRLTDDDQVNDALWTRADVEDWPEKAMREIADRLTPVNLRDTVLGSSTWTLEDLRRLAQDAREPADTLTRVKVQDEPNPYEERPAPAQEWPKAGDSGPVRFARGEAVMILKTEEVGAVLSGFLASDGYYYAVDIDGDQDTYRADQLKSLGCSYDEYIRDEMDDPGTQFGWDDEVEDEREFQPVAAPPPPQRVSEYYDQPTHTAPAGPFQVGDRVLMGGRTPGTIRYIKHGRYGVNFDHSGTTHYYDASDLTPLVEEGVSSGKAVSETPAPRPNGFLSHEDPAQVILKYWQGIAVVMQDEATQQALQRLLTLTPSEAQRLAKAGELRPLMDECYEQVRGAVWEWFEGPFTNYLDRVIQEGEV